jgi:hypothetical protein
VVINEQPREPAAARGRIRPPRRWYLGVTVLAALVIPYSAAGASIDAASDHVALHAYGRFAQGILSGIPAGQRADEHALVRSRAKVQPPGTRRWLADFRRVVTSRQTQLSAFLAILERFHSPSDNASLRVVKGLVNRADQAAKRLATSEGEKLVSALE